MRAGSWFPAPRPTRSRGQPSALASNVDRGRIGLSEGRAGRVVSPEHESCRVPDLPEGISLERHRDLRGRERGLYVRWVLLGAIAVLPVLALLNVFGQRPTSTTVDGPTASLGVTAPAHLRS